MHLPLVNHLAVLVSGVAIFMLGGLWYSPALFAKKWVSYQGRTEEELKAAAAGSNMPAMYFMALLCGLASAYAMAIVLNHFIDLTPLRATMVGVLCWAGFAAPTSFATALFSMKPKGLWLIDSAYNLVSFVIAANILARWH
ncbi:MAG: DUF1761 domain-containing protein [Holophagaceae bacterium]